MEALVKNGQHCFSWEIVFVEMQPKDSLPPK